jgi:hypothetical protein
MVGRVGVLARSTNDVYGAGASGRVCCARAGSNGLKCCWGTLSRGWLGDCWGKRCAWSLGGSVGGCG